MGELLDVGLSTVAQSAVTVTEEVTTKVVLGLFNALELIAIGLSLELVHKLFWILHCDKKIVNIDTHKLIYVSGITDPYIRVSIGWPETQFGQRVGKLFMESGTRAVKAIQGFMDDKGVTCESTKLLSSNKAYLFFGTCLKVGISNISSHQLKTIQLGKEGNDT